MAPQRVLRIWEKHRGVCCLCGARIDGTRSTWIIEHIIALELGGADDDANCGPAHATCAAVKTSDDHARAAKAKRQKQRHLGMNRPKWKPMPHGKGSPTKRRMDGQVVRRGSDD